MKALRTILSALFIFCALFFTSLFAAEPETITLDCGSGVMLDLVKIPAGKFIMGTTEPAHPLGYFSFWSCGLAGLFALIVVILIARTVIKKQRFQISILTLLSLTALAGSSLGLYFKEQELRKTWIGSEYYRYEKPAHEVVITQSFYMGKFEVTQEQYQAVMRDNRSRFIGPKNPVDNLNWGQAPSFCQKLSAQTGKKVRLPTESEWEYACRAGTSTKYYTGDDECDLAAAGWYDMNSAMKTHAVGKKKPNAWGLYDMHGNAWEWCSDRFANYDAKNSPDPYVTDHADFHVMRSGSWKNNFHDCRSAVRDWSPRYHGRYAVTAGFRVVVEMANR